MLVLSRSPLESIVITLPPSTEPSRVEVIVVAVRGDRARLGFEASREVTIHRKEVQDEIDQEPTP